MKPIDWVCLANFRLLWLGQYSINDWDIGNEIEDDHGVSIATFWSDLN